MSPDEFEDWQIYYSLEPFGSPADDERFRTLASINWYQSFKGGPPHFFDRDPEETRRKFLEPDPDLDDNLLAYFSKRAADKPK